MSGEQSRDEELRRLREEMDALRIQLKDISDELRKERIDERERAATSEEQEPRNRHQRDLGESIGEYVSGIINNVMADIHDEMDRYVFISPSGKMKIRTRGRMREASSEDPKKVAGVMGALGNEHRLKILEELSLGGLYANDLQELLPEIGASTLSSHLDVLQGAGLVVQEKARGRYLITLPGRIAFRMASQIARRIREGADRD
jgi:DNA-binding transcriptional ArsR family regulator